MKDLQNPTDIPAIAPDIAALLAVEREVPAMPDDARDRAFSRAQAALLVANQAPVTTQRRLLARTPFVAAAAATLLIAAVGAAAFQMQRGIDTPPVPSAVPLAVRPAAQAQVPPVAPVIAAPEAGIRTPTATAHRRAHPRVMPQASPDELPLLRKAREAVGRGAFAEAMVMLVEHETRFPASRFVEERDALKVRSLSGLGRMEEARRAADTFRVHFPHSVLQLQMSDAKPSVTP
jgi:hypothetical protein